MKNKKTKLLIGLLSMSVICMAGKSVNANRINSNDPVQRAQYYKVYYQNNRERILPKQKKYNQELQEEIKEYHAEYNQEHQEEIKEYYQEHKEEKKAQQKVYLAKKKAENELKLKTFDPNTSKAYNLFKEDLKMGKKELVNFASRMYDQFSKQTSLTKLGREQKRNMKLLYLWFDENWDSAENFIKINLLNFRAEYKANKNKIAVNR